VFETFNLLKRAARNSLEVAVHPRRCFYYSSDLRLPLGPDPSRCAPLPVEIALHLGKLFDDRADPLPESLAGEVPVDHFHLGLLTLLGFPGQ